MSSLTESKAKLYCVAPADVEQYWEVTGSLVRRAIDHIGLSDFDEVESALFCGAHLLWIAVDNGKIEAACTTELRKVNATKICVIVACSGENMPNWLPLISGIEDYARAEGCSSISIIGRRGWARVLNDYAPKYAILQKAL